MKNLLIFILLVAIAIIIASLNASNASAENYGYEIKNGGVYYYQNIIDADASTFKVLSAEFAKDKNFVYRKGKKADQFDAETFEMVGGMNAYGGEGYAKDKNGVYFGHNRTKIQEADSSSFNLLNPAFPAFYSKDINFVYHCFYSLCKKTEIDSTTIKYLGGYYVGDKNGIYCADATGSKKLNEADKSTFKALGMTVASNMVNSGSIYYDYAKDKNRIYHNCQQMDNVNPATFKPIDVGNSHDKEFIYFNISTEEQNKEQDNKKIIPSESTKKINLEDEKQKVNQEEQILGHDNEVRQTQENPMQQEEPAYKRSFWAWLTCLVRWLFGGKC